MELFPIECSQKNFWGKNNALIENLDRDFQMNFSSEGFTELDASDIFDGAFGAAKVSIFRNLKFK